MCILGTSELVPALMDWVTLSPNAGTFFVCTALSVFFGGALALSNMSYRHKATIPEGLMIIVP